MAMMGRGIPQDWTLGLGVFPAGGSIAVPADPQRTSVFIQNQDTVQVTISLVAQIPGTGASNTNGVFDTLTTAKIVLAPGATANSQGGALGLNLAYLMTIGAFTVTGTAGKQVAVLTT